MKIQLEPNSVIHMSGSYKEDCDGIITITNDEDYDVKYKVRTTLPHGVTVRPISEVLSGKSSRMIDIHYQGQRTDQHLKFMVLLLSLEDKQDNDNVFVEFKSQVDQRVLKAAFMTKHNMDDEFLSPMARNHQLSDEDDKDDFACNIRKKVPWLKKK
ncbi:uncharacterized protein LOC127719712 [Mytilus californianus]|uniref:uncharacterized protein LOC127719712 n=1 Tax=Mytilus californianus TaxID=6549 RepID=UPI002246BB05|nr:uncharacterized protein LOC127719712 [Mytilus californianus]